MGNEWKFMWDATSVYEFGEIGLNYILFNYYYIKTK